MKQEIIDLWKASFDDTEAFVDLFFNRVYREENTLTLSHNGRIVSALQILPRPMSYCGTTVPAAYVCGVCTLPEERGRGRMTQLMRHAMQVMRERGMALTTLIPASEWLFDYYAQFGYAKAFDCTVETHRAPAASPVPSPFRIVAASSGLSPQTLYAYYNRKQRERACAVLHGFRDWETVLLDCRMDGGDVWTAFRDSEPVGMAVAAPGDGQTVLVREIVCEQPDVKTSLIRFLLQHYGRETAQVRVMPHPSSARPYGMACILDIPLMTGLYRSYHHPANASFLPDPDIRHLTQTLLNYSRRQAWMNLMLD